MTSALNTTFGGTILYDPIMGVLNCLVLLKLQGFQKALTWVSDNAQVNFPMLANDTFSLGAIAKISGDSSSANLLADPGSSTADDISASVLELTNKLQNGIRTEAIIASCLVLIWVIVALIGVVRVCMLLFWRQKTRAEGGQAYVVDPVTENFRGHDFRPDTAAPPYEYPVNKAAPYTIQPRPFPTFEPTSNAYSSEAEKVGQVGAHTVGDSVAPPGHLRASSHGDLGGNSPFNEKSANNPFSD